MHRFFIPPTQVVRHAITLDDPRELHHLRDVLRLTVGDEVRCFDGQGTEYVGTVETSTPVAVTIRVQRSTQVPRPGPAVWLAQGLPKGERFEWLVQKATELGVERILPMITHHAVVRLSAQQGMGKQARWLRIATEAAKQCGRATVPQIDVPYRFEEAVQQLQSCRLMLLPTLAVATVPLKEVLVKKHDGPIGVLIGPEGDFSRDEVAYAQAHGARPVSLGALTLRSETAAMATLAIVQYIVS